MVTRILTPPNAPSLGRIVSILAMFATLLTGCRGPDVAKNAKRVLVYRGIKALIPDALTLTCRTETVSGLNGAYPRLDMASGEGSSFCILDVRAGRAARLEEPFQSGSREYRSLERDLEAQEGLEGRPRIENSDLGGHRFVGLSAKSKWGRAYQGYIEAGNKLLLVAFLSSKEALPAPFGDFVRSITESQPGDWESVIQYREADFAADIPMSSLYLATRKPGGRTKLEVDSRSGDWTFELGPVETHASPEAALASAKERTRAEAPTFERRLGMQTSPTLISWPLGSGQFVSIDMRNAKRGLTRGRLVVGKMTLVAGCTSALGGNSVATTQFDRVLSSVTFAQ